MKHCSGRLCPPAMALQSPPICQSPVPYTRPPRRSSSGSPSHRKTSPATQRAGGHRRVVTRKVTGGSDQPQGVDHPETADGGIRTECTRRGHLSKRSLWISTNLRAGDNSDPSPASVEVTDLLHGVLPPRWIPASS